MPTTVLKKNKEQPVHAAASQSIIRLDRDDLLSGLQERVAGEVNVSVAGTAVVDGPLDYVKSVALKTAALDLLRMPARKWFRYTEIFTGLRPPELDVASGTGVKPFNIIVPLPLEMLNVLVPGISYLPAWKYPELYFEINFGALADLYTGGTAVLQNLTNELQKEVLLDLEPELLDHTLYALARITETSKQVTQSKTDFQLDLTVGRQKRALIITTKDGTTFSDTVINNVSVKRGGGEIIQDKVGWRMLKDSNANDYRVTMPAGTAVLDFAKDKDVSRLLNGEGVDKLYLELDVTLGGGTTVVEVDEIDLQRVQWS